MLQFGSGIAALGLWGALSHSSLELVDRGSRVLALGMIVYLPITLGLPFLLPNFYRSDADQPHLARFSLLAVVWIASSTSGIGIALTLLGFPVAGPACSFAALIACSSLLQQVSRIRLRATNMAIASAYNLILPGGLLFSVLVSQEGTQVTQGSLTVATGVVVFLLLREAHRLPRAAPSARRWRALRSALPLVPHMFAFAVITQGVRIPYTISGDPIVAAHSVMLFVGLALAIITGIHGLLTTAVQLAPESDVAHELRRNLVAYMGLGGLGFVATLVAYGTGIRDLFKGAEVLPPIALVSMSLLPLLFCLYFYSTSILMRYSFSVRISLVSVPIAVTYVVTSVALLSLGAELAGSVTLYAGTIAVMAAIAFTVAKHSTASVTPSQAQLSLD